MIRAHLSSALTTNEIAEHYGRSLKETARVARARGLEPVGRVGRTLLWKPDDLPKFSKRGRGRPTNIMLGRPASAPTTTTAAPSPGSAPARRAAPGRHA